MFTVELKVGRLMEFRFEGTFTEEDIKLLRSKVAETLLKAGKMVVACVDSRRCAPLEGEVGLMLVGLMRSDNRSLERSAVLLTEGSRAAAQLEMAIAGAKNPARKAFTSALEAVDWLGPVLTPIENARVRAFYSEGS